MLLHTLRQSRLLARWVLVWVVLAMGVAVAAPAVQPINLATVCSTAAAVDDDGASGGMTTSNHHSLQCVLCLGFSAPPQHAAVSSLALPHASTLVATTGDAPVLAPRTSPLAARAPPLR